MPTANWDEALDALLVALWQCETERGFEDVAAAVNAHVTRALAKHDAEVLRAAAEAVVESFPPGELRHDGTEDPEGVAYIEGLNAARAIIRERADEAWKP